MTKKLRGWAWFKSIGSPKYIVAPMVAQSELPFRLLCRELGAQLCFTPMIHSRVWLDNSKYRAEHLQTCDADRPLVAQVGARLPPPPTAPYASPACGVSDLWPRA